MGTPKKPVSKKQPLMLLAYLTLASVTFTNVMLAFTRNLREPEEGYIIRIIFMGLSVPLLIGIVFLYINTKPGTNFISRPGIILLATLYIMSLWILTGFHFTVR